VEISQIDYIMISISIRLISKATGLILFALILTACSQLSFGSNGSDLDSSVDPLARSNSTGERYKDYEIVTLLPRDAIAAIDNPSFLSVAEANESYSDEELVLGVDINGDARAYSIPMLSSHEIVNDTVGDVKISVTW
jgi:hypothetical protein